MKKASILIMMVGGFLLNAAEHDFNGDGYSDILWKKPDGRYTIWEMGPEGRRSVNPLGKKPGRNLAGTGDFDGDGYSDILWNWGHGTYIIEKVGAESSEDLRIRTKKGWSVAGTGDFDGDGRSDILWNRGKDDYVIWKMGPDGKTGTIPVGTKKGWSVAATGDIDGDGCSDILWRRANGSYTIWKMGAGGKIGTIWPKGKKGWSAIAMGDFDGDGYSDILWYRGNETYLIWKLGPDGNTGTIWIGKKRGWIAAATGDFDGDGHSDILWNNGNDVYNIWKMGAKGKIGSILIGKKRGWKVAGRDKIWKRPLHQMPEFNSYTSEKGRVGRKITVYDIDGDPLSYCDFYTEYLDMTADSSGALYFVSPQGIVMKYRDGAPTTVNLGKGALRAVEAAPGRNRLYVLGYDGKIYIVDSRLLKTISALSRRALYLKIEVVGRRLYALRSDGVLEIFDTKNDHPIAELKNSKGLLYTDFAASSSKIALKTHNGMLDLYGAKELSAEGSYKLAIERMALYRNHLYVASGKNIRIVDLDTKEIVGSTPFVRGKTLALHLDRKKGLLLAKDAQYIKVYKIEQDGSLAGIENIRIYPGVPYTDSFLYETDGVIYPGYSVKHARISFPIPIRNNWRKHSFSMQIDLPTASNATFYFPGDSLEYKPKISVSENATILLPFRNGYQVGFYLVDYKQRKILGFYTDFNHMMSPLGSVSFDGSKAYLNYGKLIEVVDTAKKKISVRAVAPVLSLEDDELENASDAVGMLSVNPFVTSVAAHEGIALAVGSVEQLGFSRIDTSDPSHIAYRLPYRRNDYQIELPQNIQDILVKAKLSNGSKFIFKEGKIYTLTLSTTGQFLQQSGILSNFFGALTELSYTPIFEGRDAYSIPNFALADDKLFYFNSPDKKIEIYSLAGEAERTIDVKKKYVDMTEDDNRYYLLAAKSVDVVDKGGDFEFKKGFKFTQSRQGTVLAYDGKVFVYRYGRKLNIFRYRPPKPSSSKLKKTGQTKSYDQEGHEVTDGSVKDDGYYRMGVAPNYSRDDDKEIVTDHVTGLMWQDDADAANVIKNWDDAKAYCEALTLGGYGDWRLPTIEELETIVDYGKYAPAIDSVFAHVASSYYWSSTTFAANTDYAWYVYFFDGGFSYYDVKDDDGHVRCVRGGE